MQRTPKSVLTLLLAGAVATAAAQTPLTTDNGVKTLGTYTGDLNTRQSWGGTGERGMYIFNANNGANNPDFGSWAHVIEMQHGSSNDWTGQLAMGYFSGKLYFRQQYNTDWHPWQTLATEEFVQGRFDNASFQKMSFTLNDNTGTNIGVGDDAFLGDINEANTVGLKGAQDPAQGWLRFARDGNGGTRVGSDLGGNFLVENAGGRLTLSSNGNVGIGTATPSVKLDVDGDMYSHSLRFSSSPQDRVNNAPWYGIGNSNLSLGQGAPSTAYAVQLAGYWGINLQTGSGQMVMTNTGNVGIGTSNPTERLAVNGTVRSQEVRVEAGPWPDYVFHRDYALPSLDSLSATIGRLGHLPGMPSAADVMENGVALGEMNRKLLEKVEELTLYLIDVKNENTELKAQYAELRKRLERLEDKRK